MFCFLTIPVLALFIQAGNGLWNCKTTEAPRIDCSKIPKTTKLLPCQCTIEQARKNNPYALDQFELDQCTINAEWIEITRSNKDQQWPLKVQVQVGVIVKPKDFTDELLEYSDWNAAKDNRSHNIMPVMKLYFCEKGAWYSKETTTDDFLYDFNFKARQITETFENPGHVGAYYQLTAGCYKGAGSLFHIHFNVYSTNVIKTMTTESGTQGLTKATDEPCLAKQAIEFPAIEFPKVAPGHPYILTNSDPENNVEYGIKMLTGIELPGIAAEEQEYDMDDPKIINLINKLKKIINIANLRDVNSHLWENDFKWVLADKNSFVQNYALVLSMGKTIVYQIVAHCNGIVLRSTEIIASKVDKDGNCVDGYLPPNFLPKSDKTDKVWERCSPVHKNIPDTGGCKPFDYYIERKNMDPDDGIVKTFYGVTWKNRPELVDYSVEMRDEKISKKLEQKYKEFGKSKRTRFDWQALGNHHTVLLTTGTSQTINTPKRDKSYLVKVYNLVFSCGDFTFYTGITSYRVIRINDGKCIEGLGSGWGCDQLDSNGKLFVPEVREE